MQPLTEQNLNKVAGISISKVFPACYWSDQSSLDIPLRLIDIFWHAKEISVDTFEVNTLRPRWNGQHFADDIFKRVFLSENAWNSLEILLKIVPRGPINNIPASVEIMAWRRPGDKTLSEPMMVSLPTYIGVSRPQWVNVFNIFPSYYLCDDIHFITCMRVLIGLCLMGTETHYMLEHKTVI